MNDPKMTVSTDEVVRAIADLSGVSQADARKVLRALVDVCGDALFRGADVRVQGLGTFEPRAVPAREGSMGGKAWTKPAHRKVVFKPAKALRDRIA
jgi:nucleoid DNA-binding protein